MKITADTPESFASGIRGVNRHQTELFYIRKAKKTSSYIPKVTQPQEDALEAEYRSLKVKALNFVPCFTTHFGKLRMKVKDGSGKRSYQWVFTGDARQAQSNIAASTHADVTTNDNGDQTANITHGSKPTYLDVKLSRDKIKEEYKEKERRGGKRKGAGRPRKTTTTKN